MIKNRSRGGSPAPARSLWLAASELRRTRVPGAETTSRAGWARTFAIGKKLGEGGYSTIWRVHGGSPMGRRRSCR